MLEGSYFCSGTDPENFLFFRVSTLRKSMRKVPCCDADRAGEELEEM